MSSVSQNQNIYLMGDFNIDLLKYETCSYTQTLLQTMQSFSMFPVVDKPTRVYGNSATLITRDDVVSQRLKFGSAFLSSSWESKIALLF